jgi:SPP1 gp7 family putative phage head morphogenesis protein
MMQHLVAARRKYMQAVTGRKPRARPMPRALPPKAVITAYTRVMLDLVSAMRNAARRDLYPKLEAHLEKARELRGRTDAVDEDVALVKATLAQGAFSKGNLKALTAMMGRRTSDWQKKQLERQLRAGVGVEVPVRDPRLADRVQAFTEENVGLITTIPEETLGQVQKVVLASMRAGDRWEELASDIEGRFDVAESRAALIARDQVGKFFGSLNEARQTDLGITHFVWRTSHDERVREEHAALDGQRFAWDSPPSEEGIPGEAINCRCNADPDVEGLLEDL